MLVKVGTVLVSQNVFPFIVVSYRTRDLFYILVCPRKGHSAIRTRTMRWTVYMLLYHDGCFHLPTKHGSTLISLQVWVNGDAHPWPRSKTNNKFVDSRKQNCLFNRADTKKNMNTTEVEEIAKEMCCKRESNPRLLLSRRSMEGSNVTTTPLQLW